MTRTQNELSKSLVGNEEKPGHAESFETDFHIDWLKTLFPQLVEDLFKNEGSNNGVQLTLEESDQEGEIGGAQWDSDRFAPSDFPFSNIANNPVAHGEAKKASGVSSYGLQTSSNTHFDNNNIRGTVEAIAKRWEDGIENLFSTQIERTIVENNDVKARDLVGRGFEGEYAGVKNILYRFGQILHAFQDFYSHSNWIEMGHVTVNGDENYWKLKDKLLEESYEIPNSERFEQGSFIPGTDVMIAWDPQGSVNIRNNEGKDLGNFEVQGQGSYTGEGQRDIYWNVNSQDGVPGHQRNELFTISSNDNYVGGIATGATNKWVYNDEDYSVYLRDPKKPGLTEWEYFRGFSHGGFAGAQISGGQWVSPLAKDSETDLLHDEAQYYADLQSMHEFDRMGYLIFAKHGINGLVHFAEYAFNAENDRDDFIEKYSQSNPSYKDNFQANKEFVESLDRSHLEHTHLESDLISNSTGFRRLKVFVDNFDNDKTDAQLLESPYYLLDQVREDSNQPWYDSDTVFGVHSEPSFNALSPNHYELGQRATWSEYVEDNPLGSIHYVESWNSGVGVVINDFNPGIDRLILINPSQNSQQEYEEISFLNYLETKADLLEKHNILLNAKPTKKTKNPLALITNADLSALRSSQKDDIRIMASELYADPDSSLKQWSANSNKDLKFIDYDESLPWLNLDDENGELVINNNAAIPTRGSFQVTVALSDGYSIKDEQQIIINIDPKIQLADSLQVSASTPGEVSFSGFNPDGYQIAYRINGNDLTDSQNDLYVLATQPGGDSGIPGSNSGSPFSALNYKVLPISFAGGNQTGDIQFYGRSLDTTKTDLLSIATVNDQTINLKNNKGDVVASLEFDLSSDSSLPINHGFNASAYHEIVGYQLPDLSSKELTSDESTRYQVEANISTESSQAMRYGFFLSDSLTGFVIDPLTGELLDKGSDLDGLNDSNGNGLFDELASAHAIYTGEIDKNDSIPIAFNFALDHSILHQRVQLSPFMIAADGSVEIVRHGFGDPELYPGLVFSASLVGFEDNLKSSGENDYDDLMIAINSIDTSS